MTKHENSQTGQTTPGRLARGWQCFADYQGAQVDGTSLAFFRIAFGVVLAYYALSYLWPMAGSTRLAFFFSAPGFLFPYRGFEWVRPWPEPYLTLHVLVMALSGLAVALGVCYRAAAVTLFLSYTYFFLLDEAHYNNHYYLMSLLAFLLIWMPAARRWSIQAWWQSRGKEPSGDRVPFWPIFLLRAQLFIVYFYGGIAKFNSDWLSGVPMYPIGLKLRELIASIVPVPEFLGGGDFALFLAWTGLVFDLSIGFLLVWRRTRFLALVLTAIFHVTNHFLFPIGVFPVLALSATLNFLEPDWPVRVWAWLRRPSVARPDAGWLVGGALVVPVLGAAMGWKQRAAAALPGRPLRLVSALVLVWIAAQVLIPLRHYAIPGDANWTEEGHKFSWRMMLRSKQPAHLVFRVVDAGLQVTNQNGQASIDWQLWPQGPDQVMHVAVNSRRIDWRKLPDLAVLFENSLGDRLIFNPYAGGRPLVSKEQYLERINKVWLKTFGRQPAVYETIEPKEALLLARAHLREAAERDATTSRGEIDKQLAQAIKYAALLHDKQQAQNAEINLADLLRKLLTSEWAAVLRPALARMHPFAINGAKAGPGRFFVIDDAALAGPERSRQLGKFANGAAFPIWVDLARLRPHDWQQLPASLLAFIDGKPRILWNYFLELNMRQIQKMATHPAMLQRYAEHVAARWQQETGRAPEVRVLSLVTFNFRKAQMQIDPRVDLAHAQYRVFQHNDWIMPLQGELPDLPDNMFAVGNEE